MFQDFPLNALDNAKENLENLIANNKKEIKKLLKIENKTFENFMRPFMELGERLQVLFTPISHLNSVNDSKESREAFSSCIVPLTEYSTELSQNKALFEAMEEIAKKPGNTAEQQKVLNDAILSFKLGGVHLEENKKEKIRRINSRLSELADSFSKNLLDATNDYELILQTDEAIKSMPQSDKDAAKIKGGWRFTLQAPSYIAFMTYCSDRALREKTYKAYMTRAPQNSAVIEEMLKLKKEKSDILGFKNFAEMKNETMSCPSYVQAIDFLRKLSKKGRPYAEKELKELQSFAKQKGLPEPASYDTAYLSNLMKIEKLDFNDEEYRPYFEKENVVRGLFLFLKKLFGINFRPVQDTPLWHESARCYDLEDTSGKTFARIYLDLEARKEKRGGAWMNNWHTEYTDSFNKKHLPTAFIVANFPPSVNGEPSLLRHNDVNTLFHEAGHAIHHLFSKTEEIDVSGVNGVEWDAIEFPSQFLENFSYEKKALELFAKHYKTDEKLSDEMIEKLIANKNFQSGMFLVRQLEFGLFDLLIHENAYSAEEVKEILRKVRDETAVIMPPAYTAFENGFGHIFGGGYSAGYYSYKWAEMLSADAYLTFSAAGVYDKDLAEAFRENILEKGGSEKMSELFINFAGRKPDENKLLELSGIK